MFAQKNIGQKVGHLPGKQVKRIQPTLYESGQFCNDALEHYNKIVSMK